VNSNAVADLVVAIGRMLRRRGAWVVQLPAETTVRKGTPRILACYGGRFVAVEVKAPRGPGPTQSQRLQLESLDRAGAITLVARSVCEVEAVLEDLDRNPPEVLALERMIA
jgi:Holliday junction resolvase